MPNLVPLTLEWFAKNSGHLVGEETYCLELEVALDLMGIDKDYDPIIAYGYKVSQEIATRVQKYYKNRINLDEFNYFLCSYSDYTC
jgi:hypothetical protein